jgi:hypothetical protein
LTVFRHSVVYRKTELASSCDKHYRGITRRDAAEHECRTHPAQLALRHTIAAVLQSCHRAV